MAISEYASNGHFNSQGGNFILGATVPKPEEDRYREIVMKTILELTTLATTRTWLNLLCEEVAARIAPAWCGHFVFGGDPIPYQKHTELQVDATGMMALSRFMAICDSLLTPKNQTWHQIGAMDANLEKDRATREWFYLTNKKLFQYRYMPQAMFSANNQGVYHSLGAFGTGIMFIDHFYDVERRVKALRYKNIPFGEAYLKQDHQGRYCGFIRRIRYTAAEAWTAFDDCRDRLPPMILTALEQKSQRKFMFLHHVCAKDQYEPGIPGYRGMPYASYYICQDSQTFLREGGYHCLPFAGTRYYQGPNEQDGRGVAMDVLPALKTLDSEKRTFLKAGHRAADPILLMMDDGLMNMNLKPGSQNRGGWSPEGKPLVGTLPVGEIQVTEQMMAEERNLINDAFLVALFQIMTEKNGMTATEVIERINEKGILIAPTLGRQEEYLSTVIDRELTCLADMGVLDPLPPALIEAGGQYAVTYKSPLARAARAQEAAGFMRTIETVKELVNVTQDQSLLFPFAFDRAIPAIAEIQGVPEPWMATQEEVLQKKQAAAQQQQKDDQIKAAPAAAAMMKAQAAVQKAGGAGPAPAGSIPTGQAPGAPVAPVGA